MAVLAFAALATGPLGFTAGGIAATAFAAAGSIVDSALLFPAVFGKSSNIEGQRVDDLSVTSASEGSASRVCYGPEVRTGGTVIWSTDLIESRSSGGGGGGKGGNSGGTSTTYSYSMSVAIRSCETDSLPGGKISKIRKIWANNKLIYDYDAGSTAEEREDTRYSQVDFYDGDQTTPDPTIEAAIGFGDTPPFKGSAYFVIQDLQLADFGNRLPNFEVLVEASETQETGDLIERIIVNAGLQTSDVDVSAVTGNTRGIYSVGEQEPAKVLEILMQAKNITMHEDNGVMIFQDRVNTAQMIVGDSDLGAMQYGSSPSSRPFPMLRSGINDRNLPKRVTTTFVDPDCGWEQASRTAVKTNTNNSQQSRIDLPMTLNQEEGSELALRVLWANWGVRERVEFDLPPQYIRVSAGDLLEVPDSQGADNIRVNTVLRGKNFGVRIVGFVEEPNIYDQNAIVNDRSCIPADSNYSADGDIAFMVITDHHIGDPGEQIGSTGDRGADDNVCFWAYARVGEDNAGARFGLLYDADSSTGQYYSTSVRSGPARVGKLISSPPAPGGGNGGLYFEDNGSFIIETFGGWNPITETEDDVIQGANNIIIQDHNGSPEVLGFVEVTSLGNDRYEVSKFLRGRRQTQANAQAWSADTLFCWAGDFLGSGYPYSDGETRMTSQRSRTQNNEENYFKVSSANSPLSEVDPIRQDVTFGTMQPYAATDPEKYWQSDGSVLIAWHRTTRNIFKGLFQVTGYRSSPWYPPVSVNDTNNWEVDILDPTGTDVVRTIVISGYQARDRQTRHTPDTRSVSGLEASGYIAMNYSSANLIEDGYSVGDQIHVRIYQLSEDSSIGRGKVLEASI